MASQLDEAAPQRRHLFREIGKQIVASFRLSYEAAGHMARRSAILFYHAGVPTVFGRGAAGTISHNRR
jgi:hypothetical protein